jgi:hypothetical protein
MKSYKHAHNNALDREASSYRRIDKPYTQSIQKSLISPVALRDMLECNDSNKTSLDLESQELQSGGKSTHPAPVNKGVYYYLDRKKDFEKRNPELKAPDYYLNYGNKYLRRFKFETRLILSKKGKSWLDKALLNLQNEMEKGLMYNPYLEYDNKKFTDFAFDTHVKAYEDAGILDLSILDKVKIMLTVDADDLFSESGLKQAAMVGKDQLIKYLENPNFALEQAKETYHHRTQICRMIEEYAERNNIDIGPVKHLLERTLMPVILK